MKFACSIVSLVATVVSSMGSNTWRPTKMVALAKETESIPAARKSVKRGAELMKMLKKRQIAQVREEENVKEEGQSVKHPDVGVFSPKVDRELMPTCTSYVDCDDGNAVGTANTCESECGGSCCIGSNACDGFTGKVCKDGSCNGTAACSFASIEYVVESCIGYQACTYTGNYGSSVMTLSESCDGRYSCFQLASSGSIGDVKGSCKADNACSDAVIGGTLGNVENSCNGPFACKAIASDGTLGGILDSCNANNACERFGEDEIVYGSLDSCCDTAYECAEISFFRISCLESFILSHSFKGCEVNQTLTNEVELICSFNSTNGVPATAEIKSGTCASNGGFSTVASSPQTDSSEVTASLDLTPTITAADKNADFFLRDFCVRSDIFASNSTALVSLAAEKYDVEVNFTYNNDAEFEISQIDLVPFEASAEQASFTRSVGVTARIGDCDGGSVESQYAIGSILTVCVSLNDPDVVMDRVFDVTISNPPNMILDEEGNPNFLTSIEGIPGTAANITTMMLTSFFDTGSSFVTLNGLARLQFTSRRALSDGRRLVEESTEEFSLKIPVKQTDQPDFAEYEENSSMRFGIGTIAVIVSFLGSLWA